MKTLKDLIVDLSDFKDEEMASENQVVDLEEFLTRIPDYNDDIALNKVLTDEDYQYIIKELITNLRPL
jgi:Fe-S-cluster formation regulator IscX/YfhJ